MVHRLHVYARNSQPRPRVRHPCVGRRGRQRVKRSDESPARRSPVRMARVRADEETWAAFRSLAGTRSISDVLGDLVAKEVRRYRSQQLREQRLDPKELLDALEHARVQQADLELIVGRLEALARSTPPG